MNLLQKKAATLTAVAGLFAIPIIAAYTPMDIPVTGYDESRLGLPIPYGSQIALNAPAHDYLLLSGGTAVRMNVHAINGDETWEIVSADGQGTGYVKYGDRVAFALPDYSDTFLSGGTHVSSNAPDVGGTETWIIESLEFDKAGQEVLLGDFVVLRMPEVDDLLLSGGSVVRTDVTEINEDEIWQMLHVGDAAAQ